VAAVAGELQRREEGERTMADNKQVDSRIDANSTSPRQTYAEQQLAIQDAFHARTQAEQRAAESAFAAATRRPPQQLMSNSLDAGDFGIPFTVTSAPARPAGRRVGRK